MSKRLVAQILNALVAYAEANEASVWTASDGSKILDVEAGITINLTEIAQVIAKEIR